MLRPVRSLLVSAIIFVSRCAASDDRQAESCFNGARAPVSADSATIDLDRDRPATEADRYRLARRVTLDLTGLPPSPSRSRMPWNRELPTGAAK